MESKIIVGEPHSGKTMKILSLVAEELKSSKDSKIVIISYETTREQLLIGIYEALLGYSTRGRHLTMDELKKGNDEYKILHRVKIVIIKNGQKIDGGFLGNGKKVFIDSILGDDIGQIFKDLNSSIVAMSMDITQYHSIKQYLPIKLSIILIEPTKDGIYPYFSEMDLPKGYRKVAIIGGKEYADGIMLGRKLAMGTFNNDVVIEDQVTKGYIDEKALLSKVEHDLGLNRDIDTEFDKKDKVTLKIMDVKYIDSEGEPVTLWSILLRVKAAQAGGESNRLIKQHAVKVNDKVITNPSKSFNAGDKFELKVGTKRHYEVIVY